MNELIPKSLPDATELVEFIAAREDDEADFGIAEDGKLVSFFEKTVSAFGEGNLTVDFVFDSLEFDSSSTHDNEEDCYLELFLSLEIFSFVFVQV